MKYHDAFIGRTLKNNVILPTGLLLISAGSMLTEIHIARLAKFNIDASSLEFAEPVEEKNEIEGNELAPTLVEEVTGQLTEIYDFIHKNGEIPIDEVERNIVPEIQNAAAATNLFRLISDLKSSGDYRYNHSLGVSVISTLLGKWLSLNKDDLHLLTTAATLYDIGSIQLPAHLFGKKERLLPNEFEIVKTHTTLGFNILQTTADLNPRIPKIALQHHERIDGSGYPNRLSGDQIDPLAKIVAIADIYLAMTSKRPYRNAHPFFNVVSYLYSESFRKLDSRVVQTFLYRLMEAQIGKEAVLNDGRRGTILFINPNYPAQPLFRIDSDVIDLSKNKSLYINEIVG